MTKILADINASSGLAKYRIIRNNTFGRDSTAAVSLKGTCDIFFNC